MIKEMFGTLTRGGKRSFWLSVACFVVYALSGTLMMYVTLISIKGITTGDKNIMKYWVILGVCLLLKCVCSIVADLRKHYAGFDVVYQVRKGIIERLKSFSLGFYTNERLGEISTVIRKDVDNMEMVIGHVATRILADFIVSFAVFVFLAVIDIKLALLMVSVLPFAIIYITKGLKKAEKLEKTTGNDLADMVSLFVEYVKGIPLLKAFGESRRFEERLHESVSKFGESSKSVAENRARVLSVYGLIIDISYWIMLSVGFMLVLSDKVNIFDYLLLAIVSREFYKPFLNLENHRANYVTVVDSYKRIKKILTSQTVVEPEEPQKPADHSIRFENVGFSYEEGGFEIKNVSFESPQNSLTALVGSSGSGKTTVTNLLLRFWDVNEGSIMIGGRDIRNIGYDDLLGSISIVMQNVMLFADTIEGNIRIGKKNASHEEVVAAAKKARIHDFIMSLPNAYETLIGENGIGLSGGQKQRISIARAFLKDAPILLLDEITSNVDPVNEVLIEEAVSELSKNRTVLVIAHHLGTIRNADNILVFKEGRIIESGTHESLLAGEKGIYRKLWEMGN